MKFRIRTIAIVMAALAGLLAVTVVSADHQWSRYQWKSAAPVALTIGDNVSGKWDGHLLAAVADWNVSSVLSLTPVAGAANNSVDCIPDTGKIEVCNSDYGNSGWLGLAGIWIAKGKNITKGYAKMNDYYFNLAAYNSDAWRQMVMCQEVGHDFGLGHQDVNFDNPNLDTCMDYTSDPTSNQHPNTHDYDQLVSMYGGDDGGGNDKGGGPPPGKGKNGGAKPSFAPLSGGNSEWGKAIGYDGNGRANEFELDLGNGNKLITHVLWISE